MRFNLDKNSHLAHLGNRVVRGVCCLQALIARDSHTNMSCLDHSHIISAITNRQCDHLDLFLYHLYHL